MKLNNTAFAIGLIPLFAFVTLAQKPHTSHERASDLAAHRWDTVAADFRARVDDYVAVRSKLEKGLPTLTVTDDPAEIRQAVRTLAERIRRERAGAVRGEIFTSTTSVEFRKALLLKASVNICAVIVEDNPGDLPNTINGTYPEDKPRSTMPGHILAVLPALPDDIQYRFIGRHLILLDTRANVIVDRLPNAIQCAASEPVTHPQ